MTIRERLADIGNLLLGVVGVILIVTAITAAAVLLDRITGPGL